MKTKIATILATVLVTLSVAAPAYGIALARVNNTSIGATGVYGKMYVEHRFPFPEGQFLVLENTTHTRADGKKVGLAWEIYEKDYTYTTFYPVAHIRYDDGDSNYPNDEYIWWYTGAVSAPAFHTMQISQTVPSSSTSWVATRDGQNLATFWWPYPTGNIEATGQEVVVSYLDSSDFFSMGHIKDIKLRTSTGTWSTQGTGWASRITTNVYNAYGYNIVWFAPYYDWAANR